MVKGIFIMIVVIRVKVIRVLYVYRFLGNCRVVENLEYRRLWILWEIVIWVYVLMLMEEFFWLSERCIDFRIGVLFSNKNVWIKWEVFW